MATRSPVMNAMIKAASMAARQLSRDFGEVEQLQVSRKGPADFVSTADLKAEEVIYEELKRARPDFGFVMEEKGVENPKSHSHFIIDPLDGTTNYLHGLPHWAISIAVASEGQLTSGLIYDPIKDEMFWAERGRGAYLNDRRLRVSARENLDTALVATGIPWKGREGHELFNAELSAMMGKVAGVRRFGSAALDLAYVAAGRYEGFWETDLKSWDIAAGVVLVREAGGMVTEKNGKDNMMNSGSILAANPHLHGPIERILRGAERQLKAGE